MAPRRVALREGWPPAPPPQYNSPLRPLKRGCLDEAGHSRNIQKLIKCLERCRSGTRTRNSGFRVQSANHYTIGPCCVPGLRPSTQLSPLDKDKRKSDHEQEKKNYQPLRQPSLAVGTGVKYPKKMLGSSGI